MPSPSKPKKTEDVDDDSNPSSSSSSSLVQNKDKRTKKRINLPQHDNHPLPSQPTSSGSNNVFETPDQARSRVVTEQQQRQQQQHQQQQKPEQKQKQKQPQPQPQPQQQHRLTRSFSVNSSSYRAPLIENALVGRRASRISKTTTGTLEEVGVNMSPPRPTRSLPRRTASAMTSNRPSTSPNLESSPTSYALRSRSTATTSVLSSSSSNANILASRSNRPGRESCDSYGSEPPSGFSPALSTPRTPLAEIPLWLADMRSESRRSSTSSAVAMDREDSSLMVMFPRHTRTASSSSTTSSIATTSSAAAAAAPTSPVINLRRSLRIQRPRQSDENARMSPISSLGQLDSYPLIHTLSEGSMPLNNSSNSAFSTTRSSRRQSRSGILTSSLNNPGDLPCARPTTRRSLTAALTSPILQRDSLSFPHSVTPTPPRRPALAASVQMSNNSHHLENLGSNETSSTLTIFERRSRLNQSAPSNNDPMVAPDLNQIRVTRSSRRTSNVNETWQNQCNIPLPESALSSNDSTLQTLPSSPTTPVVATRSTATSTSSQPEPGSPSASSTVTNLTQASTMTDGSSIGMPPTPSSSLGSADDSPLSSEQQRPRQTRSVSRKHAVHATTEEDDESSSLGLHTIS